MNFLCIIRLFQVGFTLDVFSFPISPKKEAEKPFGQPQLRCSLPMSCRAGILAPRNNLGSSRSLTRRELVKGRVGMAASRSTESIGAKEVASRINGGKRGLISEGPKTFRVNGQKQVVVCPASSVSFRTGRLPAHASDELGQLADRGLAGLGPIEEVRVSAGGRDRAGWHARGLVVYHHPVVQS